MTAPKQVAATGGLWIKVAVNLGSRKVTYRVLKSVVDTLPGADGWPYAVKRAAAVGFLTMLWAGITEHTTDGVIEHLPDELLEDWAGWQGVGVEPGAFASWIRESHLSDDGKVRDWDDFAGALQTKRQSDAERKRAQREREKQAAHDLAKQSELELDVPERIVADKMAADDLDETARRRALALTIAANEGMRHNPAIGDRYNPIVSTRADGLQFALDTLRLDEWLLARSVYTIAKYFKPSKLGDAIRSLTYFKDSAPRVYARAKVLGIVEYEALDELPPAVFESTNGARNDHASKATTTQAGALAAAAHMGLGE